MRLLIDMNLPPRWCAFLADRGILALHWSSVGPATATDPDILAYAHRHKCILLTNGLNLSALAEVTRRSAISVVQIGAPDLAPEVIGEEVIASVRLLERQLLAGALVQVKARETAPADTRRPPCSAPHALLPERAEGSPGAHDSCLRHAPQPA